MCPILWVIPAVTLFARAAAQEPAAPQPSPPAKPFAIERVSWSKDADGPPIRAVEVHNDYGDIRARFTPDRRIEAWGVVQRLGRGPEGVGLTVERRGDVVALTVAYPPGRIQDSETAPAKDSLDRLDLTVFVPEGVALGARTLRGMVEARGLKSDVSAATLDGTISVSTKGALHARSQAGAVTASLELEGGVTPLLIETVTGAIDLTLPERPDLELTAATSARLTSAFPLRRRPPAAGRTRATASLGRALRDLVVVSERGDVTLRRR
jgi:hypothetical protein